MSGEVEKEVQQEQAAAPASLVPPAGESKDVEMTDAPPVAKTPEQELSQVAPTVPENTQNTAESPAPESTAVAQPADAPKEAVPEPVAVPEIPKVEISEPEAPKPSEAATVPAAAPIEATQADDPPIQKGHVPADGPVDGTGSKTEAAPEKPAEVATQSSAVPATEPPATQPTEDVAEKPEAAEDAAVKMLASNLDPPVNGDSSKAAEPEVPPVPAPVDAQVEKSPATGEKRKADDGADANGDANSKKVNVESTPPAPTTNGSPPARKAGRPKKEKKQPLPPGRTARRTRSQGAADV